MRGWLIGLMFAAIAVLFWDDENIRHLNMVLANIWWAASYVRVRS